MCKIMNNYVSSKSSYKKAHYYKTNSKIAYKINRKMNRKKIIIFIGTLQPIKRNLVPGRK